MVSPLHADRATRGDYESRFLGIPGDICQAVITRNSEVKCYLDKSPSSITVQTFICLSLAKLNSTFLLRHDYSM